MSEIVIRITGDAGTWTAQIEGTRFQGVGETVTAAVDALWANVFEQIVVMEQDEQRLES